jgi:hypothetical protein
MNTPARLALVFLSFSLCASGVIIAQRSSEWDATMIAFESDSFVSPYEPVATGSHHELAFSEFESVIRRHSTVKAHHGRIEFGSVKLEGANVVVQVLFFSPDGQMTPFFYTLAPKENTWKVEEVQRIWFVPRSHLLRGLQV